ncbi:MAG: hypothetical protein GY700_01635 [Propionibacteriaceae bacterium]|nr:hypothetical protein [Propionibacteriaceae bacterium]
MDQELAKAIQELKADAWSHGDVDMAALCDIALSGTPDAIEECARIIDNAAAMEES